LRPSWPAIRCPTIPPVLIRPTTYATASKVATDAAQFSLRLDHKISSKDQFFARFNLDNLTGPTTNPDQTAIDQSFGVQFIDRQRNVVRTYTRTVSPRLISNPPSASRVPRPAFLPLTTLTPAVKFNDGLFEAFNSAAGSVMQAYGNLFQGRQNIAFIVGAHAFKAGVEFRTNRDTTYFGISPNGEYDFGGGTAYATEAIPSQAARITSAPAILCLTPLSSFLSGSPFAYTVAIAPPYFSNGPHIGPAAINRNNFNVYFEDSWKVTPRSRSTTGLRWELYTPITERAKRTSGFLTVNGTQEL